MADRVYLIEYRLSVKEKPVAMRELRMMGINAMTLFPNSVEAVCKSLREVVFAVDKIGETPAERLNTFLDSMALARNVGVALAKTRPPQANPGKKE